jgi:HEAT repeat protein
MEKTDCKHINLMLIDFIDKKLDQEETKKVKVHLQSCHQCQAELEHLLLVITDLHLIQDEQPSEKMRDNFLNMLQKEKSKQKDKETISDTSTKKIWLYNPFSQIAAGLVILISGAFLGMLLNKQPQNNGEVAQLQSEVEQVKQLLVLAKLDQPSASQRILAANYTQEITKPNDKILTALVETMNNDENVNVRMASIYALSKFTSEKSVREALVESLKSQEDALLQITLINILVQIKEESSIDVMKELLQKEETIEAVKQMAEKGITTFI